MGAHVAVADGEVALGTAHQTAQVGIGAALNQSRHVEVLDGGAIGVLEGGGIYGISGVVEVQRIALAVEDAFERMRSTRHCCHADVGGEFYGLSVEAIQIGIILHTLAEVVPPVGVLDGIGVAVLREVVVIHRECERGTESHVLIGHGECVGIVAVIDDVAVGEAHACVVACHGQRRHALAHLRREGDGNCFAFNSSFWVDIKLLILVVNHFPLYHLEILGHNVVRSVDSNSGSHSITTCGMGSSCIIRSSIIVVIVECANSIELCISIEI